MQRAASKPSTNRYRAYKSWIRRPDKWTLEADGPFGKPIRSIQFLGLEEGQTVGVTSTLFTDWVLWARTLKRLEVLYKQTKQLRGVWVAADSNGRAFVLRRVDLYVAASFRPQSLQAFADAYAAFKKLCRRHRQERAKCPYPLMFPRRYLLLVTLAKQLQACKRLVL